MKGVEKLFDTESVTGGQEFPIYAFPKRYSKLGAQPVQTVTTKILVEIKSYLTARPGLAAASGLLFSSSWIGS
jgi:hypothetical protein